MNIVKVIETLTEMNTQFGEGVVTRVEIDIRDSSYSHDPKIPSVWVGRVHLEIEGREDWRMWKLTERVLTYLSRRRVIR